MHPCSRGEVFPKESRVSISDYWPASLVDLDINVKETKALSNTLFSFGDKLRDARVDAYIDNQALVRAWQSQAARSSSFSDALKELSNRKGKTTVHKSACQFFGRKGSFSCLCPTRLAYETVDSLIGKLRALFNESGRRGEWDPRLLTGNPATEISLKQYLKGLFSVPKIKQEYFHNNRYPTILSVVYITTFLCIVCICLTTSQSEDSDPPSPARSHDALHYLQCM